MPTQAPFVNGNYYSFANIEERVAGYLLLGFKSINYGAKIGSQFVRGTNKMPLGKTAGQFEPHGDAEIYLPQFNDLVQTFGPNFSAVQFTITVTYGNLTDNAGLPTITDALYFCNIIEVDASNTEGLDASVRKVTLLPLDIWFNGVSMCSGLPVIGAIG